MKTQKRGEIIHAFCGDTGRMESNRAESQIAGGRTASTAQLAWI